jgi:hypothetical protein
MLIHQPGEPQYISTEIDLANNAIIASNAAPTNQYLRNVANTLINAVQLLRQIELDDDPPPIVPPPLTRQNAYFVPNHMNMGGGYYKRKTNKKRKTKRR